ncbi:DUF2231 domain-containing protein [Kribbella sindirgiensis]|uniref:DUF2231 domain-containing protein n=1 Tax=Kribbella sindirgiensis TaxID=1124744 RepID=A0A4R0ID47_9ACTN|nr:DUF2231 domain-containing protein [Kribbella sindirgiensis]TCC21559.1 hypothetical protein E0H50_35325 [Kribbella sindirgiensis]
MQTVNGLPAHVLLVHAVVVLLPLSAAILALTASWPAARRRLAGPNAILAALVVALVPITTSAGEWLEHRVAPNPLIRRHAELGDTAIYVAVGVAALAVVVWWRQRESTAGTATKRTFLAPASNAVTVVVTVAAVVVSAVAVYDVVRIGDSGAKASWNNWAARP